MSIIYVGEEIRSLEEKRRSGRSSCTEGVRILHELIVRYATTAVLPITFSATQLNNKH